MLLLCDSSDVKLFAFAEEGDARNARRESCNERHPSLFCRVVFTTLILPLALTASLFGQAQPSDGRLEHRTHAASLERDTFKRLLRDQTTIWTSPAKIRPSTLVWLTPWSGLTATLIATDRDVTRQVSANKSDVRAAKRISDVGLAGMLGVAGGLYLSGVASGNPHARETGWLAGEAIANGLVVNTVLQQATLRNRPLAASHPGEWRRSGSAFPSDHSIAAWAAATVIANEYPGWATRFLAFGSAAAVSTTRVLARQHSPSDVFVGSTLGYLIGRGVYRAHHRPDLPGASIGTFESVAQGIGFRATRSPYVPMDSMIYAQFDRLIAGGYLDSAVLGQRPWTRSECARLLREGSSRTGAERSLDAIYHALAKEFAPELDEETYDASFPLEEVYARGLFIGGEPLRDDFHFGRTVINDYGRPYWEGGNTIVGASGTAGIGVFNLHMRGEYQYAAGGPVYSPTTRAYLATADVVPDAPVPTNESASQFRLLEAYVQTSVRKVSVSVGKQDLWWGPAASGPWLYSTNSEPIYMARVSLQSPIVLPSFLGWLGPVSVDSFFGKLAGHRYPTGPYIHGQKVTLKPTPNLELGFSRTVLFAGEGRPLTFRSFWRSFSSLGDSTQSTPGSQFDVGDRKGGFDFSYRLPYLRDRLTVYGDFYTEDDPSPLAAPHRAAINLGFYAPRLPKLPKMDLRVEAPVTDRPAEGVPRPVTFFYYNFAYRNGYTNKGAILGNSIGRNGKGINATSRYWITPDSSLGFGFRHNTISRVFLPGGGNLTDCSVSYTAPFGGRIQFDTSVQVERWNFPLLSAKPEINVLGSAKLTYHFRAASTTKH